MPLNPILKKLIEDMAAISAPAIMDLPPTEGRAMYRSMQDGATRVAIAQVRDELVENIPIRIYTPTLGEKLPCLVYFHGGGWVIGDLETHDAVCRKIANEAHCMVIAVDYRLAPEHPFPAPLEDCLKVTQWVIDQSEELNVSDIAVGGDSAGGNLATCVCLKLREGKYKDAIAHQILIYPVTDALMDSESYSDNAEGYFLTRDTMRWFWACYIGERDKKDVDYSPLHETNLQALPSATVITAEFDPLRDEGEDYARKLQSAGVSVHSKRYDGLIHGFISMSDILEEAQDAIELVASNLRAAFNERN